MFSETCDWVTGFNKISSSNGTYQYQIVTLPNTTTSSRTCTVTVSQEGGESTTFDITQEGAAPAATCVIGETITSNGGNGTKVTVGKGGTKTLTIYTKENSMFGMVSVEPDTYDSDLVSIQNTASSQTEFHTTWVLTASNSKTGSTDITFKNGCGEYVVPFEVTAATQVTYSYSGTAENFGCQNAGC